MTAPMRVFITSTAGFIGFHQARHLDFVDVRWAETGYHAQRHYLPMQAGDVPATWADCTLLKRLTGYAPRTPIREGVARFVRWYLEYRKEAGFI